MNKTKNEQKKKKGFSKGILSILALLVIGLITTTGLISAYRGDPSVQGPNYDSARYDAMTEAINNGDYDQWYSLMTEDGRHPRIVDVITSDNFDTFKEIHDAMVSGDYDLAASLKEELGLNNGVGPKDGTGYKRMAGKNGEGKGLGNGNGNGQGQRMRDGTGAGNGYKYNFVDADGDGVCDNLQ